MPRVDSLAGFVTSFALVISLGGTQVLGAAPQQKLQYRIVESESLKKGGQLDPIVMPQYTALRVSAVLIGEKELTDVGVREVLSEIVESVRKSDKPDAIDVFLYETDAHIGSSTTVGRAEWWPREHSLSPDNDSNIRDKDSYLFKATVSLPEVAQDTVNRLSKKERRTIFSALVKSEDRANDEAERKHPTDGSLIPMNKLRTYDFESALRSNKTLSQKLHKKYRKGILRKYKIAEGELDLISEEAWKERWPLPQ